MAALAADTLTQSAPRSGRESYVLTNAQVIYAGSLCYLDTTTGLITKTPADLATMKFVGVCLAGTTGNTSASPPVEVRINDGGIILRNVTIAGTFTTQAKCGLPVYNATSDNINDCTLTAPTNMKAIGIAVRFVSSGVGDVKLFTHTEHAAL